MRLFISIEVHTTHLAQHPDITLQNIPNPEYTLRLFLENEERELHTQDNRTWTPSQRPYVPCFPITLNLLIDVNLQGRFSDIQDTRGNSDEEGSFILGEGPTDECNHRP